MSPNPVESVNLIEQLREAMSEIDFESEVLERIDKMSKSEINEEINKMLDKINDPDTNIEIRERCSKEARVLGITFLRKYQ